MSQVKKLQAGGKFAIDSRSWDSSNPDFLLALEEHINNAPHQYLPYLGTVISDLKSGRDVIGDRAANTSTFSKPRVMSDKEWDRAAKPRSKNRKYWDSIVGTQYDLLDGAIAYLNSFNYKPKQTVSAANKRKIASEKGLFDYNTNPDGTKTYSQSNPNNASYIQRANDWYDYLSGAPAGEGYDDWDLSGYNNVDAVKAWYAGLNNPRQYWDDVIARTKSGNGTFSPEDEDFWNWMNIGVAKQSTNGDNGDNNGNPKNDNDGQKLLNVAQVGKGAPALVIGENGRPMLINGWDIDTSSKPYIITEDDVDLFGPNYQNWVIYGNELYNQDEILKKPQSTLGQIMRQVLAIQKNRETAPKNKWDSLNQIVQWKDSNGEYPFLDYNAESAYLPDFYNYFSRDDFKYDWYNPDTRQIQSRFDNFQLGDVTSLYDNIPIGSRIYRYFNHGDPFNQVTWGFRQPHYAVYTPNGIQSYVDEQQMLDALGLSRNITGTYRPITAYDWVDIPGKGKFGEYNIIKDTDGNDWKIFWQDGKFYTIGVKNKVKELSVNLVDKIFNHPGTVNRRELTEGLTDEELTRRQNMSGWSYGTYKKNGGKIEYIRKLQTAGTIPGSSYSPTRKTEIERTPGQRSARLGETKTNADVLQAVGIAGDVLGAIASLVPGYGSIAGAGLGIGSTGMYLASDIKRDGLDWGDVGSAGLNLVFDAATLLPVIGESAKVAKIATTVSKAAKILTPLMSAYGLTAAVSAINKISSGEKPTVDDLQALAAGLQGVIGMGHVARQNIGEARLSAAIKNGQAVNQVKNYSKNLKVKGSSGEITTKNIKLNPTEVNRVISSNNPEGTLKSILRDTYKVDDGELNAKKLLEDFGFDVERSLIKRKVKSVSEQPDAEKTTTWKELHPFRPITGALQRTKFIETSIKDPNVRANIDKIIGRERSSITTEHEIQPRVITTESGQRRVMPGIIDMVERTTVSPGKRNAIARAYANYLHQNAIPDPTEMSYAGRRLAPKVETSSISEIMPLERQLTVIPLDTRVPGQQNVDGAVFGTPAQRQEVLRTAAETKWRESKGIRPSAKEFAQNLADQRRVESTSTWWSELDDMNPTEVAKMVSETSGTNDAMAIIRRLNSRRRKAVLKRLEKTNPNLFKRISSRLEGTVLHQNRIEKSMNLLDRLSSSEDISSELRKMLNNQSESTLIKKEAQSFFNAAVDRAKRSAASNRDFYRKRNAIINMFKDAGITIDTKRFKEGGIVKALDGLKTPSLKFENPYENPVFKQGVWTVKPKFQITPSWQDNTSDINTKSSNEGNPVGDWPDYYDIGQHVNHAYSIARLANSVISSGLINKKTNKAIDALGVAKPIAMREDAPIWSSAEEERQLAAIDAQNARPLVYTTGDPTLDRAMVLSNQQSSLQNRLGVLANLSKKWDEYQYNLTAVGNRNRQYALTAENEYKEAAQQLKNTKAMQRAQADTNMIGSIGQSLSNYLYQNQTNSYNNRKKGLDLLAETAMKPEETRYNIGKQSALEELYGAEYAAAADKNQYSSIESWAMAHHPEDFNNVNSDISSRLRLLQDAYLTNLRRIQQETVLNDSSDLWRTTTGSLLGNPSLTRFGIRFKKGGRLNGSTRYTLEPDERIWIEQNKAAFKASSKLNDNIIKLFLKLK